MGIYRPTVGGLWTEEDAPIDEPCTKCGEYIGDKLYQVDQDVNLCWYCLREFEAMWEEHHEMFEVN